MLCKNMALLGKITDTIHHEKAQSLHLQNTRQIQVPKKGDI